MKTLTINIGLDTNDGGKVPLHQAVLTLNNRFNILKSRLDVSPNGGEETLVAIVEYWSCAYVKKLHEICDLLKQDCIATFDGENGKLIGPNAAKWGNFNPDFFVQF